MSKKMPSAMRWHFVNDQKNIDFYSSRKIENKANITKIIINDIKILLFAMSCIMYANSRNDMGSPFFVFFI
jgi:hypothetical protein